MNFQVSHPAASEEAYQKPHVIFLKNGMDILNQASGVRERDRSNYLRALNKLERTGCRSELPGQTGRIDWVEIQSLIELEVCLFLIAAQLDTAEQMSELLRRSGFKQAKMYSQAASITKHYGFEGEGILLSTTMLMRDVPKQTVGFFDRLWAVGLSVGVLFDGENSPKNVSVTITRK